MAGSADRTKVCLSGLMHQPLAIRGLSLGVAQAGVKPGSQRNDLVLISMPPGAVAAGVFTKNAFCAAPVVIARQHLEQTMPRLLLINSGNANAGTGQDGIDDALASCRSAADLAKLSVKEVLPFSTGVIGEPLPVERICASLPQAYADLSPEGWSRAAEAIMTTDTRSKLASVSLKVEGVEVRITGMAKGSGMIHPDMATMLAFIATDAVVDQAALSRILTELVDESFNCISVDGDTSTNDACMLLATGVSGCSIDLGSSSDAAGKAFRTAMARVFQDLARQIVADGEGATKLIRIVVEDGETVEACRRVGFTIAHSPLVKTAFFASDPNWGRILAAIGRSGLEGLDVSGVAIDLDEVALVRGGARAETYTEELGTEVMSRPEITVRVRLGRGTSRATILTTDLSHEYIRINAEYRT